MSDSGLLLSFGAYARARGWSQQYVSKLVKIGKITPVEGKIDPVAADKELAESADPRRDAVRNANAARRVSLPPPPPPPAPTVIEVRAEPQLGDHPTFDPQQPLDFEGMTQTEAQTAKLRIQAKRETLQYQKDVAEVVEITAVRRAVADVGPTVSRFSTIPDRLASRLAAEMDVRKIYAMLAVEIDACQQEVADFARALVDKLTATQQ